MGRINSLCAGSDQFFPTCRNFRAFIMIRDIIGGQIADERGVSDDQANAVVAVSGRVQDSSVNPPTDKKLLDFVPRK